MLVPGTPPWPAGCRSRAVWGGRSYCVRLVRAATNTFVTHALEQPSSLESSALFLTCPLSHGLQDGRAARLRLRFWHG